MLVEGRVISLGAVSLLFASDHAIKQWFVPFSHDKISSIFTKDL